jgi:hypothetical protein
MRNPPLLFLPHLNIGGFEWQAGKSRLHACHAGNDAADGACDNDLMHQQGNIGARGMTREEENVSFNL